MKERPILFSAPMVRALLDGSKTQTRRVCKPANEHCLSYVVGPFEERADLGTSQFGDEEGDLMFSCPYGKPGDHLWVRETHRPIFGQTCGLIGVDFRADLREKWERLGDQIGTPTKWVPSIHMRREYSRILLEITSIRVERLNACSESDAAAEGVKRAQRAISSAEAVPCFWDYLRDRPEYRNARDSYASLWESINGAGSWDANPWVWVVEFKWVTQKD